MPKISALPTMPTPDDDDEFAIVDVSDSTTKKVTPLTMAGYVSDNLTQGSAFKPADIAMFSAYKNANQATGTTNTNTKILFQVKSEYKGTSHYDASTSLWTAPANGWIEVASNVGVDGGDGVDDTSIYGFQKNGIVVANFITNWRYYSRAGIEYNDSISCGFQVSAGDTVNVFFGDIGAISMTLRASYCWFSGRFTPDYT